MALDLDAITARFKRASKVEPPPTRSLAPPVAGLASRAAEQGPLAPGPPTPRPRPKRRRWTMPSSPTDRRAEPVDPPPSGYRCPHCGKDHQPILMHATGMAAVYGPALLPQPGQGRRPTPLGREPGHTSALVRDSFHPWRAHPAAEPPPSTPSTLRERIAVWWQGDAP